MMKNRRQPAPLLCMPFVKLWSRQFTVIVSSNLLLTSAFYALLPTLPVYLTKGLHFSQGTTGIIVASLSVSMVLTRPFTGYLMDNYHRFAVLVVSFLAYSVICGAYLLTTTIAAILLLRFLHGAAFGTSTSALATITADVTPVARRGEGSAFWV